jgi:hypothetical protein
LSRGTAAPRLPAAREITGFFAVGFEIGITGSTTSQMSPRQALDNWRSSPPITT